MSKIRNNKEIRNKERELELGKIILAYQNGEASYHEAWVAAEEIFNMNMTKVQGQVSDFFKKTKINYYSYEDLLQDCYFILWKKIWEYNPNFNTTVYTKIFYHVKKTLSVKSNLNRPIPVTETISVRSFEIKKAERKWESSPDLQRICRKSEYVKSVLKITDKQYNLAKSVTSDVFTLQYYDKNDNDYTFEDFLISPDLDVEEQIEDKVVLRNLLKELSEEEKKVILYEYGFTNECPENYTKKESRSILKKMKEIANERM